MVVALLPATTTDLEPTEAQVRLWMVMIDAFERGESISALARRVHPKDKRARVKLARTMYRTAAEDEHFQGMVLRRAKANMIIGLPATAAALTRMARKRPDAAKLLFEATGFHNPRVKHEHSGEVKITLDMPRPNFDTEISPAEVVEE